MPHLSALQRSLVSPNLTAVECIISRVSSQPFWIYVIVHPRRVATSDFNKAFPAIIRNFLLAGIVRYVVMYLKPSQS